MNATKWLAIAGLGAGLWGCEGELYEGEHPTRSDGSADWGDDDGGSSSGGSSGDEGGSSGGGSSGGGSDDGSAEAAGDCADDGVVGFDVGDCAPDFELIDGSGGSVALSELAAAPTLVIGTAEW